MRRAFTLIELLVVIAIIAALAAIVFPVFAQAKEAAKKTSTLSKMKQEGTALVMYAADSDDLFPIGQPVTVSTGAVLWNFYPAVPANWDNGRVVYDEDDTVAWPNSTSRYRRNHELLEAEGVQVGDTDPSLDYSHPIGGIIGNSNFTMNGLLASYPSGAIAQPSRLTLLWQGEYKMNVRGYGDVNPALRCNAGTSARCMFNPDGLPQTGATTSAGRADAVWDAYLISANTMWVYGRGMCFVFADTSAKFRSIGAPGVGVAVNSHDDPGASYGATDQPPGYLNALHRCRTSPDAPYYTSFFRPDSEFDYRFGTAVEGCGPS